jgi:hypothetical protein
MIVRKSQEGISEKRHSAAAETALFPSRNGAGASWNFHGRDDAPFPANDCI